MKTACTVGRLGKTVGALCLAFLAGNVFVSSLRAQSLPTRLGDLDADGRATVLDLVRLIGHINATNPLPAVLQLFADINEDSGINTNDITLLQDAILGLAPLPNPFSAPLVNATVTATNGTNILITGVGRPNRTIIIQGGLGVFTAVTDSNGNFSVLITLQPNRVNILFLTASNGTFTAGIPQPLRIIQDSEPPSLYLDFPTNNQVLTTSNTVIAGRVGDMLSGFMGLSVAVSAVAADVSPLTTNTGPANVNVGIGNNGSFERGNVPLALGANEITVTASDIHGNSTVRVIRVFRGEISGPRLYALSGDMQMTNIGRRLAQPIVLRVTQADGTTPFANKLVDLQVTRNDGRLLPVDTNALANPAALTNDITRTPGGIMHLQLFTDANGEARAWWTLGGAAGCGNNRVCVSSAGVSNAAYFCASAAPAPVKQINIGTGNNQKAETGAFVTEPLRAWVGDSCNGVPGIPITFTVIQGGGRLFPSPGGEGQGEGGTNSLTITSSITGHASALLRLGPDAGQNLIETTYPGNPGLPATFIAYGVARDPARPTTFSGLVLDNTSHPIGHAHCELHVGGQTLATFTDSQGRFNFTNTLAGPASIHVDGLSATSLGTNSIPPGTFPPLHFSFTLIQNAENSLPMPVLLPCMNTNNAQVYHGTNDLLLTCQGIEGLKMTIKANSMRHPNGTLVTPVTPVTLSLNQVHHENVPMPMPDGASPPFAWTLQPGGAHFDPPITIEYPNMSGLPAGGIAYFLSFNHDTERFEIVASGHVADDSATIVTDPGAGLSIAGWGCNCPPYSVVGKCCRVSISGSSAMAVGQKIRLTATGTPPDGTFGWSIVGTSFARFVSGNSGPSVTVEGVAPGEVIVGVTYRPPNASADQSCRAEHPVTVTQYRLLFSSIKNGGQFQRPFNRPAEIAGPNDFTFLVGSRSITVKMDPEPPAGSYAWSVSPINHSPAVPTIPPSGAVGADGQFAFTPYATKDNRPLHSNAARAVSYKVVVTEGSSKLAEATIAQDLKNRMRQEYIDWKLNDSTFGPTGVGLENGVPPSGELELNSGYLFGTGNYGTLVWNQGYVTLVQNIRSRLSAVSITSGYRSPSHQKRAGTALNSEHQWGAAIDFRPEPRPDRVLALTADGRAAKWLEAYEAASLSSATRILLEPPFEADDRGVPFRILTFPFPDFDTDDDGLPDNTMVATPQEPVNPYSMMSWTGSGPYLGLIHIDLQGAGAQLAGEPAARFFPASDGDDVLIEDTEILDDTWTVTVNGQSVLVNPDGTFTIPNISAPDQFGSGGPGTAPDFLGDDYVRLIGQSTADGVNRFVSSEFFRVRQGRAVSITNLTFTPTYSPPPKPESLSIQVSNRTVFIGQTLSLTVLARYADGTTLDVASRTRYSSYRVSNPNIANVSPDGVVTPVARGVVYVTAGNDGRVFCFEVILS